MKEIYKYLYFILCRKIFKQKIKDFNMKLGRKISGGKYIQPRKKKSYEIAGQRRTVKLGEEEKIKNKRVRGGNKKIFLLKTKLINVCDKGRNKKLEIKNVVETPSNRFLARQNVITRGAIVETSEGKVRVTSRPSQEGVINGVLIRG